MLFFMLQLLQQGFDSYRLRRLVWRRQLLCIPSFTLTIQLDKQLGCVVGEAINLIQNKLLRSCSCKRCRSTMFC